MVDVNSPSHWQTKRAEDVCEYIQRGKQPEYDETGEVRIINQRCIYWDELRFSNVRRLSDSQRPEWQEYRYLHPGDVLLNSTGVGTVGRAQIFPGHEKPFVVDGHVTVIRPSEQLNSRFLYYFLRSRSGQEQIIPEGATGQVELRKKDILDIKVPIPPVHEQERMVRKLDPIFTKIQDTHDMVRESEEISQKIMTSVLKSVMNRASAKYGDELVKNVCKEIKNGGTPKRSVDEYWGGEIPWLKSGELNNSILYDSEEYITETGLSESSAKIFDSNTVLVAMYGATRGESALIRSKMSTNQAVCGLTSDPAKCLPEYLWYALRALQAELASQGRGGGQDNINQTTIKNSKIPLPTLSEQHRIIKKLEKLEENITQIRSSTERETNILDNLPNAVLNKAFSGELVGHHIADDKEPPQAALTEFKN